MCGIASGADVQFLRDSRIIVCNNELTSQAELIQIFSLLISQKKINARKYVHLIMGLPKSSFTNVSVRTVVVKKKFPYRY